MESTKSTPHCSFIVYLDKDAAHLPSFFKDLRGFFQKFPLAYELVAVVEKNAEETLRHLQAAQKESPTQESVKIVFNETHLGRAESLRRAFDKAESNYLILTDPVFATPLGDLFKILQNLMTDTSVPVCWGERTSKKDSLYNRANQRRHRIEHFFAGILKEKNHLSITDPLCEIGGFTKKSWEDAKELLPQKLSGWYLYPDLYRAFKSAHIATQETAIHDSGNTSLSYKFFSVRLQLLKKSLF